MKLGATKRMVSGPDERAGRGSVPLSGSTLPAQAGRTLCALVLALVLAGLLAACRRKPGESAGDNTRSPAASGPPLIAFAGAASQPATSEVMKVFEKKTGIPVECMFGGSGAVLNQIRMEHYGDIYVPGSNDYMDIAERERHTDPGTRRVICYLVPTICVRKGNPSRIQSLRDLARPGLRITIGDPGSVCLGVIARDVLQTAGIYEAVRGNIVTFASDCQQVVSLIRLGEVDAAIGYDVFGRQSPSEIELVSIAGAKAVNIPAAVVRYSRQPEKAQRFVEFISGPKGREIFAKHGYTTRTTD